jgi:hypothetical protein
MSNGLPCKPKLDCYVHNIQPLDQIVIPMNPILPIAPIYLEIQFNIILPSKLASHKWPLSSYFPTKILYFYYICKCSVSEFAGYSVQIFIQIQANSKRR